MLMFRVFQFLIASCNTQFIFDIIVVRRSYEQRFNILILDIRVFLFLIVLCNAVFTSTDDLAVTINDFKALNIYD